MIAELTPEEGLRLRVYDDATGQPIVKGSVVQGNPTIGIGRNLASKGITEDEAHYLCADDIAEVEDQLDKNLAWWRGMSARRQMALADMCFNMGLSVLLTFTTFLGYLEAGEWEKAAEDLKGTAWWGQVGTRGPKIAARILEG